MLLKALNKFNGNICFVGSVSDKYDVIFEYALDGSYSYVQSLYLVKTLSYVNTNRYLVSFSDYNKSNIYEFSGGAFNFVCTTPLLDISQIVYANESLEEYYILSSEDNVLVRCTISPSYSLIYSISLPDYAYRDNGKILVMNNTNNRIIYHNLENAYLLEDDGSEFKILNSITIGDGSDLVSCFKPMDSILPVYARIRQFDGSDLGSSSSSSSI